MAQLPLVLAACASGESDLREGGGKKRRKEREGKNPKKE